MAYSPPSIGPAGFTVPSFQDILDFLKSNTQDIYGPGEYLGNDSALFQVISIVSLATSDAYSGAILDFNNHSPNFATGAALSSVVKLNGLTRKVASFSTCLVTVSGAPGTTINNGIVRDSVPQQGALWDLPSVVLIPVGGSVDTVATCQVVGALNALPGQLNLIATPTAGWTSVTNATAAILGQPVETDSQLRTRQAISTELPSITIFAGTLAGVEAVAGVTRATGDENPTNVVNANGNPAHSITMVVEGGTDADVAQAIYNNKGLGCFTNGTIHVNVTDPNSGLVQSVGFLRPTNVPIFVTLGVHALAGYSSSVGIAIQNAIVNYLNSLVIGEDITLSALYAVAMSATPNLQNPEFSIRSLTLGITATPVGTADIQLNFNLVAQGILANIVLNVV